MKESDFDLEHQNQSMESRIVASLEKISQAFRVLLWQESREFSLSPIQVQVLIFLLHHSEEKRKVSYLAGEFNMTKATISDTVKALDQKGLIAKAYEPEDTRSYIIHLTERGREIATETSLFTREIHAPIDKLHADDKENLLLSLLNIIRHLNKAGIITIPRMCMTCTYYESSGNGQKHFCKLLNQNLHVTDLRIDCPEHELKAD
ncbi:MarR family winged helix-turn-helix transcriptional regulator [Agriterribacter sp.]|uniref:MarR family winged helix-turn-helix transcriptional regulator n=1 Tax=Agriterribacter sp. TaxID=2821509 RepID=UPI002B8532F3|nr:MarR family winged helix-turn-helix transcriptional regulator [Agriterribacter sp.]HRO46247.1 MarR family winged helix-turn-helix transcriptional regulator [Agriterribacter sp.]HRQ18420.1 MarR family winged helix-turn-helix transcriptional regulator [Agriterribacter sp.]